MDVAVETAISDNILLSSNDIGVGPDDHVRINAIHDIRITSFANSYDDAILDTDISFVDASVVNDQGVCENQIQTVNVRTSRSLTHAITNTLATAKGTLIAVLSKVPLDLDPEISSAQADKITSGRAEHSNISFTLKSKHVKVSRIASRFGGVMEATLLQFLNKRIGNPRIMERASSDAIASFDDLVATNQDKVDSFSITRLKANGGSSSNIQPVSQGSDTIEVE